eukprot:Trichotokara_eunicae@DN6225_c0_g1_i1.p1
MLVEKPEIATAGYAGGLKAEGEVETGTTICAFSFDGGIVIAADTRTSAGQYIVNRASRKLTPLGERIFVARSGSAADTQALSKIVKMHLSSHEVELGCPARVETAACLLQLLAYNNKDNLTAGLIVAGVDDVKGAQVYSIPLGGSKIQVPYSLGGSGSGFITAMVDAEYKEGMSKGDALAFARRVVSHAMYRDGSSGGMVRAIVVTKESVEESVISDTQLPIY